MKTSLSRYIQDMGVLHVGCWCCVTLVRPGKEILPLRLLEQEKRSVL